MSDKNKLMERNVKQNAKRFENWGKVGVLSLMVVALYADFATAQSQPVSLQLDDVELHGSLLMPTEASGLVIVHAGSGPTDRDGNPPGMPNNSLKMLAEALADQGLVVLRFDKRGVGASSYDADESLMRPDHYINDLAAWVEWAHRQPGIRQVHLLGHSEGALFAKAAANRVPVDSVISLAGAGRRAGQLLLEQTEGRRPGQIGEQFEFILGELEAGRKVDDVSPMLNALFRPSVQPYLIEWLAMDRQQWLHRLIRPCW
jgi:pimeloyl-ACP methyl ester carboxylesterase